MGARDTITPRNAIDGYRFAPPILRASIRWIKPCQTPINFQRSRTFVVERIASEPSQNPWPHRNKDGLLRCARMTGQIARTTVLHFSRNERSLIAERLDQYTACAVAGCTKASTACRGSACLARRATSSRGIETRWCNRFVRSLVGGDVGEKGYDAVQFRRGAWLNSRSRAGSSGDLSLSISCGLTLARPKVVGCGTIIMMASPAVTPARYDVDCSTCRPAVGCRPTQTGLRRDLALDELADLVVGLRRSLENFATRSCHLNDL